MQVIPRAMGRSFKSICGTLCGVLGCHDPVLIFESRGGVPQVVGRFSGAVVHTRVCSKWADLVLTFCLG